VLPTFRTPRKASVAAAQRWAGPPGLCTVRQVSKPRPSRSLRGF